MYKLRKGAIHMKKISKIFLLFTVLFGLAYSATFIGQALKVHAVADISEKPVVVYGGNLDDNQIEEVRSLLDVDTEEVSEMEVTGADIAHYIDGNPNSNRYSSAKITSKNSGHGIAVHIVTADNITQVTSEMYSNALLTAGVENALIEVASPIQVTEHYALTGIYKAYDEGGEELDQDRMEVANEELTSSTKLTESGVSDEEVAELLAEIKKEIAEQDPATKEDIEEIVTEQLDKLDISLSEED